MEAHSKFGTRHVGYLCVPPRKPFKKGGKMLAKVNKLRSQKVIISTVFLGLDHNHCGYYGNKPILFESMVFGGNWDNYYKRYFTWDEAKEAHENLVSVVTKTICPS